jgi:histidine triad (HIT) family protein
MGDCVFCEIIKKNISARIEYEDKDVIVFHTIKSLMPIHLLVVPKKHLETLDDAKNEDQLLLGRVFLVAKRVAAKMKVSGRYKVVMNVGKEGGQSVFHVHLHLLAGKKMGEL